MNFLAKVLMGILLMCTAPAWAQTSVGPDVGEEQGAHLVSLSTAESGALADVGTSGATPAATESYCSVPSVLAESEFAISCNISNYDFLVRARNACPEKSSKKVGDACAVIDNVLDPDVLFTDERGSDVDEAFLRERNLVPVWTIRIGSVSHPPRIEDTVVTVLQSNSSEVKVDWDKLDWLLGPKRVGDRVVEYKTSGTGTRPDQTTGLHSEGIYYFPALLIPRSRANEVMDRDAVKAKFETPIQIVQDLEKLLNPRCLLYKLSC